MSYVYIYVRSHCLKIATKCHLKIKGCFQIISMGGPLGPAILTSLPTIQAWWRRVKMSNPTKVQPRNIYRIGLFFPPYMSPIQTADTIETHSSNHQTWLFYMHEISWNSHIINDMKPSSTTWIECLYIHCFERREGERRLTNELSRYLLSIFHVPSRSLGTIWKTPQSWRLAGVSVSACLEKKS